MDNDDPVAVYLREVSAIPALTSDQEVELSRHVLDHDQQAESAGKRLIEANLAMVVSIAEGYRDTGVHMLDLIRRGNDGLLVALPTFARGSMENFSAHAAACIHDAIVKGLTKR